MDITQEISCFVATAAVHVSKCRYNFFQLFLKLFTNNFLSFVWFKHMDFNSRDALFDTFYFFIHFYLFNFILVLFRLKIFDEFLTPERKLSMQKLGTGICVLIFIYKTLNNEIIYVGGSWFGLV